MSSISRKPRGREVVDLEFVFEFERMERPLAGGTIQIQVQG